MDCEHSIPFIQATKLVCRNVLAMEIYPQAPLVVNCFAPKHFVTGTVAVHGDRHGVIALGVDRLFALRATQLLLGHKASGVDSFVVDVMSELTNQIAGAARQRLNGMELDVSIPRVICGVTQSIDFPNDCKRVSFPFTSLWGNISVDFGFNRVEEVVLGPPALKSRLRA